MNTNKGVKYMNSFKIIPRKLKNDEIQIIIENAIHNNEDIPDSIIKHFTYVIYGKMNKYLKVSNEDLYSECLILLLKCYRKYDLTKQIKFTTYYIHSLTLFMTRYINKNITYANKMGNQEMDEFVKLKNKVQKNEATPKEIEFFEIKSQELYNINKLKTVECKSKNDFVDENIELKLFLAKVKKILNNREFTIYNLKAIYEFNYSEIAEKLNMSKAGVGKNYKKLMIKLKNELKIM